MTTGRINQITNLSGTPEGLAQRQPARRAQPPRGRGRELRYKEGAPESARPSRQPRRTGGATGDHPIAPTKPLETSPQRRCSDRVALTDGGRLRHMAFGWRTGPRGHAGERRIPQGGYLQESRFQVWPAANHPQTPTEPGTKRPPDFGCRYAARNTRPMPEPNRIHRYPGTWRCEHQQARGIRGQA